MININSHLQAFLWSFSGVQWPRDCPAYTLLPALKTGYKMEIISLEFSA
uniref:Alternative protein C20orf132 n=1 Tax=Homo sapiens TaxID=9606 RepID=L8ECN0_HUMAN|nr:alternative protein C20orf132 [Homo sapiens]